MTHGDIPMARICFSLHLARPVKGFCTVHVAGQPQPEGHDRAGRRNLAAA